MAGASITIDYKFNDQEIIAAFNRLLELGSDKTPIMEAMGRKLLVSHRTRHEARVAPDGTPWEPLSEVSRKLKEKKGGDAELILVLTGHLIDLHYDINGNELKISAGHDSEDYAAMHQFGGTTGAGSWVPGKEIPARPFLGISDDDETMILEIVQDHLHSAIE